MTKSERMKKVTAASLQVVEATRPDHRGTEVTMKCGHRQVSASPTPPEVGVRVICLLCKIAALQTYRETPGEAA